MQPTTSIYNQWLIMYLGIYHFYQIVFYKIYKYNIGANPRGAKGG